MPYLGNSHIAGDQINNFKVLDDISSHTSTFDGSSSGVVSISDNTIRIPEHRFVQGQRVTYNNGGGGNIGNLSSGTAYYIIKDTNNTIKLATSLSNANNSTAINLSVLGSGSSHTLNIAFDGVNTKFKITHDGGTPGRINNATQLSLAINNVIQRPNQNALTFTEGFAIEDQHKIVFKVAPVSSDIFWGSILANTLPTFDITDNKIDNFTGDGSTTEFNLSNIPASNKSIMVTINGVLQHPSDGSTSRSYTLLANVLQFTAAPGNGDEIQVRHIGFAGASTSDVTGFYGRTGNVVLTSNDHITTGNINAGVVTATTFVGNLTGNVSGNLTVGGVLTYEDVTNVDSIGIVTARSGFKVLAGGANVVGVITARTNVHLEDYIHHLGDLTTKIGFPSAGNFTLDTSGSERLRIDSSGDLSIPGNSSVKDITYGDGSTTGYFRSTTNVNRASADQSIHMQQFRWNNTKVAEIKVLTGDDTTNKDNAHIVFETANSGTTAERLRIASDGNISISRDLDVDGHTNLDNVSIAGVTTITGALDVINNANTTIRIYDSTGTPDSFGSIGYNNGNDADDALVIAVDGDNQQGNSQMRFYVDGITSSAEKFRVDSDGVKVTGDAVISGITTSTAGFMFGTDGEHYLYKSAANTATLRVTSDGPYVEFKDVSGDVQLGSASGTLRLSAGGAEKLSINSSGNITQTGSSYLIDSAGSAEFILDRANTSSGATVAYKTGGTLKWYNGLRGLVNDDFYLRSEGGNLDVLYIQTYGNIFHNCNSAGNPAGITIKNVNTNGYSHARLRLESENAARYADIWCDKPNEALRLAYNSSSSVFIKSDGKVGINQSSPNWMLDIENPNPNNDSKQQLQRWVNGGQNTLELNMYGGSVDQCQFAATNAEQTISFLTGENTGSNVVSTETTLLMTQNRDVWLQGPGTGNYGGALFIGRSASPYGNLGALRDSNGRPMVYLAGKYPEITMCHEDASNASHGPTLRFQTYVSSTNTATGSQFTIGTNGPGSVLDIGHGTAGQNANAHNGINNFNGTTRFRVTTSGCQVFGSLSKNSGSFRIDHPLVGLSTTTDLVHSFIEGPQADLIYRGVVDLTDGTATVNVDTAGRMTQGTFEALCTNVSCFTSNETDWTAVKGSVSGNILTITAQDNTSTATVSWMVVGERKDKHMKDTNWTDENGRVITEPLKDS